MNSVVGNLLRTLMLVGATIALMGGTASAQFTPGITLQPDATRPLSPEEQQKRKAVDDAYKSAIQKIPNQPKSADPWGNIRSTTPAQSNTKRSQ